MDLTLLVTDLSVDADELTPERAAVLPSLPALATLLRFGDRETAGAGDWRRLLALRAGRPDLAAQPVARIVAAATREPARVDWIAQPVSLQAAMDHLRLAASGVLRLADPERAILCETFASAFGGDGYRLEPAASGALLLSLPEVVDATTTDPAGFAGSAVGTATAGGPGASTLRRLQSEIEMWLHDLPLNHQRARRGLPPVNGLWLWGGGAAAELPQRREVPLPRLFADDPFVHGLARLCGAQAAPLPANLTACGSGDGEAAGPGADAAIVVLDALPRGPRDQPLQRIEDDWIAPALQALRERHVARVTLVAGGGHFVLRPGAQWRLWRRARPWWQSLGRGGTS